MNPIPGILNLKALTTDFLHQGGKALHLFFCIFCSCFFCCILGCTPVSHLKNSDSLVHPKAPLSQLLEASNCKDGEVFSYSLPLVKGTLPHVSEGTLIVTDQYGVKTHWPIYNHRYKFLVKLKLGLNAIQVFDGKVKHLIHLEFKSNMTEHKTKIFYYLASDGAGEMDAPPGVKNSKDEALKRIKLDALLLQSFFAESYKQSREMVFAKQNISRKTFHFELDQFGDPIVHIVQHRTMTRAQLLSRNNENADIYEFITMINAQHLWREPSEQWDPAKTVHMAWSGIAHLDPVTGRYASGLARGGGGLSGGGVGMIHTANLISHAPSLEKVDEHFLDATPFDPKYIVEDSYLKGNFWGSYTATLGGMMHEFGHALSLPHVNVGVMASDASNHINRFFNVYEIAGDGSKFAITEDNEIRDHEIWPWWPKESIGILEQSPYIY